MRIRIHHETTYRFDPPARALTQLVRLEPRETSAQQVRNWRIETASDAFLRRSEDSFGNILHTLQAEGPIEQFSLIASGEIHTEDTSGVISGTYEPLPLGLFLRETALTRPTAEMEHFAQEHMADRAQLDALHSLMNALHATLTYQPDSTSMATSAKEAWESERGVCQDFSHIFAACARSQGIPTRYVSGYLHEDAPQGSDLAQQSQMQTQSQSQTVGSADGKSDATQDARGPSTHAWNEAYVDGLGWVAFDVTHRLCPTEHYARLAVGLDALDASPIRGVHQGTAEEVMDVKLAIFGSAFGH